MQPVYNVVIRHNTVLYSVGLRCHANMRPYWQNAVSSVRLPMRNRDGGFGWTDSQGRQHLWQGTWPGCLWRYIDGGFEYAKAAIESGLRSP